MLNEHCVSNIFYIIFEFSADKISFLIISNDIKICMSIIKNICSFTFIASGKLKNCRKFFCFNMIFYVCWHQNTYISFYFPPNFMTFCSYSCIHMMSVLNERSNEWHVKQKKQDKTKEEEEEKNDEREVYMCVYICTNTIESLQ